MVGIALGAGAVFLATMLGGVTGFAYGLVSVPLLLLIGFPLVDIVAANLAIAMLTRVAVVYRLREHVDRRRALSLIAGSIPGIAMGHLVRQRIDPTALKAGAGALAIGCAVLLLVRPRSGAWAGSRVGGLAAGVSGGFLGVTTSFNGVPPVLWLSSVEIQPLEFIADLAVYFVVGNLIALPAVLLGGGVPLSRVGGLVLAWLPVGLLGNAVGLRLAPRVAKPVFRLVTLSLVFVAGLATLATA